MPMHVHRVMDASAHSTSDDRLPSDPSIVTAEAVEDVRLQADEIRQSVREEEAVRARQLIDEALRESVREQVAAFERAAEDLTAQMRAAWNQRLADLEQQSVMLVTAMAEKVIARKLDLDDQIVLEVVRTALAEAGDATQVLLRVSAADEPLVRDAQAELLAGLAGADDVRVLADDSIGRGGCIVETERGRFDARIETQLQLLGQQVEHMMKAG